MRLACILCLVALVSCSQAVRYMPEDAEFVADAKYQVGLEQVILCDVQFSAAKVIKGELVYNWKAVTVLSEEYSIEPVDEDTHSWLVSAGIVTFEAWLDSSNHALGKVIFAIRAPKWKGMIFIRIRTQTVDGSEVSDWGLPFPVWSIGKEASP